LKEGKKIGRRKELEISTNNLRKFLFFKARKASKEYIDLVQEIPKEGRKKER